jgi:hypothetical protein
MLDAGLTGSVEISDGAPSSVVPASEISTLLSQTSIEHKDSRCEA